MTTKVPSFLLAMTHILSKQWLIRFGSCVMAGSIVDGDMEDYKRLLLSNVAANSQDKQWC